MKEKSIFLYKLYLSLNISDFTDFMFYVKIPPRKVTLSFLATPSENRGPIQLAIEELAKKTKNKRKTKPQFDITVSIHLSVTSEQTFCHFVHREALLIH